MYKNITLIFIIVCIFIITQGNTTLQQVHVIFRHGDKTPEKVAMYPKDPYLNETWYPNGYGSLTNHGKMQVYNIGKTLRKRYNDFLGKIYSPDLIYAQSTNFDRTKMSLQLVLAGLWPPTPLQMWNSLLPWQPIPYLYYPMDQDKLLKFPLSYCSKYQEEYNKAMRSEQIENFIKSNEQTIEYINRNSGLNCNKTLDLFMLYFVLFAEDRLNLKLPDWTQKIYPEFLEKAVLLEYQIQTYNEEMLKSAGGHFIKKLIEDSTDKMEDTQITKTRKMFLYSGHEWNIVYTLATLNVFDSKIPPYASYIIFELHKINNQFGFKIFYQDYMQKNPRLLILPGCEEFCLYENFIKLIGNVLPKNDDAIENLRDCCRTCPSNIKKLTNFSISRRVTKLKRTE